MIRTSLVVLMVLFVFESNAQIASFSFSAPEGAELEKYPIMPGPLSIADQAKLGLSAKKLDRPVDIFNHYRNVRGGRFVFETLPANTLVLVSADGKLRYKTDCGNRLVEPVKCPICPTKNSDFNQNALGGGKKTNPAGDAGSPGAWSRFWGNLGKSWDSMWGGLGSLLGFLLPLLLILGLLALIAYAIGRALQNRRGNGTTNATATAVQNPPPAQAAAPQVAPVQPAQQAAAPPAAPAPNVPPANTPTAGPGPTNPTTPQRNFRFTVGNEGNVYSKMNGYRNVRWVEGPDGSLTINVDRT